MVRTTTQGTVRPLTGFNGFVTRENLFKIIRQQFVNNADGRRCMEYPRKHYDPCSENSLCYVKHNRIKIKYELKRIHDEKQSISGRFSVSIKN